MKLAVAANYDIDIVSELARYPVDEVFGKFPADFIGGGRPSYLASPLSKKHLAAYIARLRDFNIHFNYLLNPACTSNNEFTRPWQKQLNNALSMLADMGVTRLTVTTPFLLEAIKSRSPSFKIKIGLYSMVDTLRRAKFWQDLGADSINLECRSINRDLTRLLAIRRAVTCELQLIANHICIPNCPMLGYHQNSIAHASAGSSTLFIDYCFLRCSRMRLHDPSLLIKSPWIRPEDIPFYESLGYTTFKILDRNIPSEDILKRIKAYSDCRFEGNLADILLPYGFSKSPKRSRFWALKNFFKPLQVDTRHVPEFFKILKPQGMLSNTDRPIFEIDSSAIPCGFIESFQNRDCSMLDCANCRFCDEVAQKAVRVDPAIRENLLAGYSRVEKLMSGGGLWGV